MGVHRKPQKLPQNGHGPEAKERNGDTFSKRSKPKSSQLLFEPQSEWHSIDLPTIKIPETLSTPSPKLVQSIHEYAKQLLEAETAAYGQSHQQSSSAHKFYTTIMSTGTWSDKVSALTLLVQESPIHNTKALDNLLGMAAKKNRQQALMALGALKDMLAQGNMLPSDRKLRLFSKQPGLLAALQGFKAFSVSSKADLPKGLKQEHLLMWAYEDYLKSKYFELLKILETWCNDEVEFARMRAITFVWELLKDKPEQEENLLRLLVNKLGDTDKKVASRASHLLLQTQVLHPSMKPVIIDSIESEVLLRPGQSAHAKYYAVITLNQTILSSNAPETANKLLDVYFSLFVTMLNKSKNQKGPKPEAKNDQKHEQDGPSKKRKRPGSGPPAVGEDKAEQELEEKITAQVLTGVNRAFPYSKSDGETFEKHLDTMFRITHSSNFNTSVQALMLIQQISSSHHISTDRFMRTLYESLLDPRLLKSSKQTMYLNLLYRSLKSDVSVRRVKAFVKRLVQTLSVHEPAFISAVLYLILELQNLFPSLRSLLDQPETLEEDEEEVFHDVVSDDESPTTASTTNPERQAMMKASEAPDKNAYDGRKRDPEHSNADRTCLWELTPWLTHYHPSVSLFAKALLQPSTPSAKPPPKPDPQSHTLMHFLDRFAYRNVRTKHLSADAIPVRGTSLMQPALGATSATDTLYSRERGAAQSLPVNREAFWSRRAEEVAPDEVFFHKYFGEVSAYKKSAKAGKADGDEKRKKPAGMDDDEWDEEVGAGEDEIWKALVGSRKELGDDGDLDMDDDSGLDEDDVDIADEMDSDDEELDGLLSEGEDGSDGFGEDEDFGSGDEGVELNLDSDVDSDAEVEGLDIPSEGPKTLDDFADFDDESSEDDIDVNLDSDAEVEQPVPKKSKLSSKESREKKKKLKALPMFASAEDYAKLIEENDAPDGGSYT
ncbi:hypothetical protein FH972_022114 [Carpinus fangiana]|uniref:CCAAT-binding factor domain-containing protein n=1 Tax=Carpinus fangiana TaxID=176857 RepID=A0A5N6KRV2_9ROSI|nr:hypothetical protein FH972_022114 [Carpinus fangiana]